MARMSIDDKFLRDPRVTQLALDLGMSRWEAMGRLLAVFAVCYDLERDVVNPTLIDHAADRAGFSDALFEVDLAVTTKRGLRIRGVKKRIEYLAPKREAGRQGGIKSGESRRNSAKQKRTNLEATVNPPDPVPDSAPDPVPEDQISPSRAIPLVVQEQHPAGGAGAAAPVPALSPPAPAREDIAGTQPIAGDQFEASILSNSPALPVTWTDQQAIVHRDAKPQNVPPPPVLPGSIARADAKRHVIATAWQLGGQAFRELGRDGIDPTAPDPWAGLPAADDEAMKLLIKHVDRLLVGEPPDAERALAVIRRRIDVAKAEGRAASPPTRRWLTPMRIWDPVSFAKGAEMSPEQVRPRTTPTAGQRAGPVPAPPRPRDRDPPPKAIPRDQLAGPEQFAEARALLAAVTSNDDDTPTDEKPRRKASK